MPIVEGPLFGSHLWVTELGLPASQQLLVLNESHRSPRKGHPPGLKWPWASMNPTHASLLLPMHPSIRLLTLLPFPSSPSISPSSSPSFLPLSYLPTVSPRIPPALSPHPYSARHSPKHWGCVHELGRQGPCSHGLHLQGVWA